MKRESFACKECGTRYVDPDPFFGACDNCHPLPELDFCSHCKDHAAPRWEPECGWLSACCDAPFISPDDYPGA